MSFDWLTEEIIQLLLRGLVLTVWLTAITSVLALVLGVIMGLLKLSNRRIWRWVANLYIEIHRNVPALVLMIFWAFAFPNLFSADIRQSLFYDNAIVHGLEALTGLSVPYYTLAAGVALSLNTGAYLAEIFRAGVGTIAKEHVDAAQTLGASRGVVIRHILIPQGLRAAFPAISTRLIHNLKNTALAALIATPEFFHNIQAAITRSFMAVQLLLVAAVVYLGLAYLFGWLLRGVERYLNRPMNPIDPPGMPTDHLPELALE